MAYTTINKSTDYFNTKIYTGNGGTQSITGVGHQPDMVWTKSRGNSNNNNIYDAVRGATKRDFTNSTSSESTVSNTLTSFDSDGFSLGSQDNVNASGITMASWNWKAGGAGSANTAGSINSTVSVSTTGGFSIVKYTGNGSNPSTVGHGLGAVPKMIIIKNLDQGTDWQVYHASTGNTKGLLLNTTAAAFTSSFWGNTTPTNSVFTLGVGDVNTNNINYIAYCFAEKTGYSKFGKLISNGLDDNTFTYTGFAPKLVILKPNVTDGWSHWYMFDTARDTNLNDKPLYANLNTQEAYYGGSPATDYAQMDILSNGFKIRRDGNWGGGGSGKELLYMAFGQSLVGSNGVTAKAR